MRKFAFLPVFLLSLMVLTNCVHSRNAEMGAKPAKEKNNNSNPMNPKEDTRTKVLIKTTLGDIVIALYDETPLHRNNFIKLVNENYYDGILFHRIIQSFMIQAGDPDSKTASKEARLGGGGPGYTVPAEFNDNLFHKRGAVAAARMGDQMNPTKASSGSQFYIVDGRVFSTEELAMFAQRQIHLSEKQKETYATVGGAPHLDGNYTVFGEVVEGLDIVDKIAAVAKDNLDRPLNDVKIISAKIIK